MFTRVLGALIMGFAVLSIFTSSLWVPPTMAGGDLIQKVDSWLGIIFCTVAILTGLLSFSEVFMQHAAEQGAMPQPWRVISYLMDLGIVISLVVTNRPIIAGIVFMMGIMTLGNLMRAYDSHKHALPKAST